uniref:Ig-like domain-containing protein n=1 Tax=Anser cygnoides TaxID=8845 RepID=A0A8B9EFP0_ANSCY
MQLHHPIELLGTSWMFLAGLLVPLQQAVEAEGALQRRVVVVGSSVLLAGPADAVHIHSAQWEYLNGTVSRAIVQYNEGSHNVAIHPPYVGRALFHPSNGSLLLEDLQESDSGIYKVTFNLAERESLKILLDVLKPVSRPQLWSSGLVAKATGEVLCEVVEGRVDTITWKKDGQALPQGRGFYVSGNLSILHLRAVKKSDCGSYSCNASNGISWQETSLNVTVAGLSPPLKDVLRIAVVAVVFAAVSGWGLIFPVCQSEKLRIRGELWRWLSAYTCGLVCVSSILAGTAGLLWMREEGPSIAIILPEIVLLYVIVVTFLVAANVTFQPTKLIQLKSTTGPSGPLKCPCPSARILFQPARHWGCFTLG